MPFLSFHVTFPDESTARQLSEHLLGQRLVACVHLFPISSMYWWDGVLQHDSEWVGVLKTSLELEQAVETAVLAMHPYEVPAILRSEERANAAYEQWILESVRTAP